jgi:hypothetical protein
VKSENAALAAEWITNRFAPRVVVVQRDLRSVLASWTVIGFGAPRPSVFDAVRAEARRRWHVDLPEFREKIERAAVLCAVTKLALDDGLRRHPEWITLSHEAACTDAAGTFERAAVAAGLEWSDECVAFLRENDAPGSGYATRRVAAELPDQWRERLTSEQVERIDAVLDHFPPELRDTARR